MNVFQKSLLLIDGHSHFYRAFYALPTLTNIQGDLCHAIYGVINQIKNLFFTYKPTQIIIIFDSPKKNFRYTLYHNYKKNRPKMPENLKIQLLPLIKIIKYSGIPIIIHPQVEADDVIGSLTYQALKNNYNMIKISTNDKDISQLVNSNVSIIHSSSKKILGPIEIEKKFGVPPKHITSLLALTGDKSDNIPGVPKIGPKIAITLIKNFGNLKNIYRNLEKIKESNMRGSKQIFYNLKENKKLAFLSLKLVTIKSDIFFDINKKKLQLSKPHKKKLSLLFNFYQFYTWEKKLQLHKWFLLNEQKNNDTIKIKPNIHTIIYNKSTFIKWILKIKKSNIFSFLIETDFVCGKINNILSITLAINPNEIIHLSFIKNNIHQLNSQNVLTYLKPFFEDKSKTKIIYNLKFNIKLLKNFSIKLLGKTYDVILTSYILYNKIYLENDKKIISEKLCSQNNEKLYFSIKEQFEKMYNIFTSHIQMFKVLEKDKCIKKILETVDIPLTTTILKIESNGVLIDNKILKKYSLNIKTKMNLLKKQAYQITGETFNLTSSKQSQIFLFKKIGLYSNVKTKNGVLSTNEKVLLSLSKKHPLPLIILQYRSLKKLKTTYIDKLLKIQNKKTKRVYTCYQQTSTITGRLSSINPNLQNIPIRTKEGKYIREAFIAPPGYLILSADYSQIELRILAHLSKDKTLIKAFHNNEDIHCLTASELFHVNYSDVTKNQRQIAKTINFSLIYGMSAFGLSKKLNISVEQSKKYINDYFLKYTNVQKYLSVVNQTAISNGFVNTLNGRKIYIPNLHSKIYTLRKSAERTSINAPMQGSVADIIKKAMININTYIEKNNLHNDIKMIMQVHDELVFEIKLQNIDYLRKKIKKIMENSIKLTIPLKINIEIGNNWHQASH